LPRGYAIGASIAFHPALPNQIAHAMRVQPATGAINRSFSLVKFEDVLATTNPARITIFVEAAVIGNKNKPVARI
jgi:hypothetical protein